MIGGVTLGERLGAGPYGTWFKAHTASRRDLRALLIAPDLLADAHFAAELADERCLSSLTSFDHPAVVPTVSVARGGGDVAVVTVGPGRFITLEEFLAQVRERGGKLAPEVAAAIGQAVAQGVAAAHQRGIVHGAIHPRSILIDDVGQIRLTDFAAGRALTSAVAQGADGALWRGLAGFVAPELALGEAPSARSDVFSLGAVVFAMLVGSPPPGPLGTSPAVQRVVQRAVDTDSGRRYATAAELLEALLEAFDDDRWTVADASELRRLTGQGGAGAGGRPPTGGDLDDETEDLLASLSSTAARSAPTRPSIDLKAAASAARSGGVPGGLSALLDDLSDDDRKEELTQVDDAGGLGRDPISELISLDRRPGGATGPALRVGAPTGDRLPAFDGESAEHTPLPAPMTFDTASEGTPLPPTRPATQDEAAALDAIAGLDDSEDLEHEPATKLDRPVRAPAPSAPVRAAAPPPRAARSSAPRPAASADDPASDPAPAPRRRALPVDQPSFEDVPTPQLRSRFGWVWILVAGVAIAGGVYLYRQKQAEQRAAEKAAELRRQQAADLSDKLRDELADPGDIHISTNPAEAAVWMSLGRTPVTSPGLPSTKMHELRVELDGHVPIDTQVLGTHWIGDPKARVATMKVDLRRLDPKKDLATLPAVPPKPPAADPSSFPPGRGVLKVDSTPQGAQVWMLVGITNPTAKMTGFEAGRAYEFKIVRDGYLPAYVQITAEEWRDGGDPKLPLSAAPKKTVMAKSVELAPDPTPDARRK